MNKHLSLKEMIEFIIKDKELVKGKFKITEIGFEKRWTEFNITGYSLNFAVEEIKEVDKCEKSRPEKTGYREY